MANQRTFGRRADARTANESPALQRAPAGRFAPAPRKESSPSRIEESHDSEPAPEHRFRIPWRQLSLMASLCFGIASFVLPDSVNDNVQWLLYALMAASLYAGFSKRLRAKH
jgi:hypothetical protein